MYRRFKDWGLAVCIVVTGEDRGNLWLIFLDLEHPRVLQIPNTRASLVSQRLVPVISVILQPVSERLPCRPIQNKGDSTPTSQHASNHHPTAVPLALHLFLHLIV